MRGSRYCTTVAAIDFLYAFNHVQSRQCTTPFHSPSHRIESVYNPTQAHTNHFINIVSYYNHNNLLTQTGIHERERQTRRKKKNRKGPILGPTRCRVFKGSTLKYSRSSAMGRAPTFASAIMSREVWDRSCSSFF